MKGVARLRHLAGRFFGALSRTPPTSTDLVWVETHLMPATWRVWRSQPAHDQRHAVLVARDVERRLAGTPDGDDSRWITASLVHDLGKVDSGLGVIGRAVATVVASVAGHRRVANWSTRGGLRGRFGRYVRHPERGAAMLRAAGEPEAIACWTEVHQEPARRARCAIPATVVAALVAADDD